MKSNNMLSLLLKLNNTRIQIDLISESQKAELRLPWQTNSFHQLICLSSVSVVCSVHLSSVLLITGKVFCLS